MSKLIKSIPEVLADALGDQPPSTFELAGYRHLSIKVKCHYDDRTLVHTYDWNVEGWRHENSVQHNHRFGKDEYLWVSIRAEFTRNYRQDYTG